MTNDENIKDKNIDDALCVNSKFVEQLQNVAGVFNILKEFSSSPLQKAIETKVEELAADTIGQALTRQTLQDPLRMAMDSAIQKMIIENIERSFSPLDEEGKSKPKSVTHHKDEDIPIYKKLSPGDIYIMKIIGDELEVVENHDGEIVYIRVKLSQIT